MHGRVLFQSLKPPHTAAAAAALYLARHTPNCFVACLFIYRDGRPRRLAAMKIYTIFEMPENYSQAISFHRPFPLKYPFIYNNP